MSKRQYSEFLTPAQCQHRIGKVVLISLAFLVVLIRPIVINWPGASLELFELKEGDLDNVHQRKAAETYNRALYLHHGLVGFFDLLALSDVMYG